jgi:CBS domain-containing protein
MVTEQPKRSGMRIMDRAEYNTKPKPLTFTADTKVIDAVEAMSENNYGSVVVVDDKKKVIGMVTERDIMKKLVRRGMDPKKTDLSQIMTSNPRVAKEDDDLLDWLRIMSNERFRRLPVVDNNGRIKALFTQGDFVSYTWPDLIYQAKEISKATFSRDFNPYIIGAAILVYTLAMVLILQVT